MIDPANLQTRTCTADDLRHLRPLVDAEREALGHIPWPAFVARAKRGDVIVANDDFGVLGYTLVYLPSRRITSPMQLHHICVRISARRRGIGSMLVASATALADTAGRQIVQAWCRITLPACHFWRALQFDPVAIRAGGAKRGAPLILWRSALSEATRQNGVYWTLPSRAGAAAKLNTPMRHLDADESMRITLCRDDQLDANLRALRCDRPGKSLR